MSLLQTQNLSLKQGDRVLITDLNLMIGAGEAWIVLGENGCGKSTLLASLAAWFKPSGGTVLLGGQAIMQLAPAQRARAMAWQVQQDECPFPMTVLEKTLTGRHPYLSRWQWESGADVTLAQQQLARLDLADFGARDLASLSGGERRRVSLATALTQQAPLLLLDEPLSQLDLRHQQQALGVLREELQQGRSIVMVSHDPNHAKQFATHALLLFGNGQWKAGVLADVLNAEMLSKLYHYPVFEMQQEGQSWFVPLS